MKVITPEEMKQIEERGEEIGVPKLLMMENAGAAVARYIIDKFSPLANKQIVVVCGTGNNGGDGFVCARHLAGLASVSVFLLGSREQVKTVEGKTNLDIIMHMKSVHFYDAKATNFLKRIREAIEEADIIVDAIFGTGVKGSIKEPHASAIVMINASPAYKVAVDIPSGLDPATGRVHDLCVKAHVTITFHAIKKGLVGSEEIAGELLVVPIGIPPDAEFHD